MMFSAMYANPFDELAVNDRAPFTDAPIHTPMALCSLSTGIILPFENGKRAAYSTISVCGVIG